MFNVVKLWLKIFLGFIFSVFVIVLLVSYGLIGTVAMDTLEIVITEATGLQQEEAMISANLNPYIIQNTMWLAISVLGFCLVFLYFLDMNLKSFLAPGFLAIVTVIFVQIIHSIIRVFVPYEAEATGHILSYLERIDEASIIMGIIGILLMLAATVGQKSLENYRSRKYGITY